jgi:hypothetical protein
VRRLAREHGSDLDRIVGSGPGGRVTRTDVVAAAAPPPPVPDPTALPPGRLCVVDVDMSSLLRSSTPPDRLGMLAAVVEAVIRSGLVDVDALQVDLGDGRMVVLDHPSELSRSGLIRRLTPEPQPGPDSKPESEPDPRRAGAPGRVTVGMSGDRGVLFDAPRLAHGQVAAFDLGAVVERPVVIRRPDGEPVVAIRPLAQLALTYDQVDGPRLLSVVRQRLEAEPSSGAGR